MGYAVYLTASEGREASLRAALDSQSVCDGIADMTPSRKKGQAEAYNFLPGPSEESQTQ
jgi:hypothetical protein